MVISQSNRSRAQVILIGAITLAFIILGIVVVFNGVLYTETLSSGGSSQSASDAAVTEMEVERGVGCLLYRVKSSTDKQNKSEWESPVQENISEFNDAYRNSTAGSSPVVVNISARNDEPTNWIENESDSGNLSAVHVDVVYNSTETSYKQEMNISASCPPGES